MSDPILFELTHSGTQGKSFSPHVWKTKIDFAILGVDYTPALRSFDLIRGDLAGECGNDKVTVPTLKTAQGDYITDSWAIAEHLEDTYGTEGKTLFPGGAAGKSLLKFLDSWLMTTFAVELRPIVGPIVYHNLNKASQEIWLKNRFSSDQSKLDAFLAFPIDPARVSEQIEKARTRLQSIEDLLAYQQAQGSGWLVGDKPSHADALVFGFYVFQALSPQVKKELWEHESLPLTRAWVDKVKGLVSAGSLP